MHSGYLRIQERYDERKKRRRALHARMLLSQSYQEWRSWALQIEKLDAEQAVAGGYKARGVKHPGSLLGSLLQKSNRRSAAQEQSRHSRVHVCSMKGGQ